VERFNQRADAEERIERAQEHLLRALRHFFEEPGVRAVVTEMRSGENPLNTVSRGINRPMKVPRQAERPASRARLCKAPLS
jgi:hypothetical protein